MVTQNIIFYVGTMLFALSAGVIVIQSMSGQSRNKMRRGTTVQSRLLQMFGRWLRAQFTRVTAGTSAIMTLMIILAIAVSVQFPVYRRGTCAHSIVPQSPRCIAVL